MADALVAALTRPSPGPEVEDLWLTEPLGIVGGIGTTFANSATLP